MRKMILTGALVLFGAGTTPQVVTALAVCILWFGLVANLNPFEEDADDRLAQTEAIQILFTLLIGLVLQLQAASEPAAGGSSDSDVLGVILVALNCVVVLLALVQQPIVAKVASKMIRCAVCVKRRINATREWESAWLTIPSDGECRDDWLVHDYWVDTSTAPPRELDERPLALVADPQGDVWIDGHGSAVTDPIRAVVDGGYPVWIDRGPPSRLLATPLTRLGTALSFTAATHWLDASSQRLLTKAPRRLIFVEPGEVGTAQRVWRHRQSGTLSVVDPAFLTAKSDMVTSTTTSSSSRTDEHRRAETIDLSVEMLKMGGVSLGVPPKYGDGREQGTDGAARPEATVSNPLRASGEDERKGALNAQREPPEPRRARGHNPDGTARPEAKTLNPLRAGKATEHGRADSKRERAERRRMRRHGADADHALAARKRLNDGAVVEMTVRTHASRVVVLAPRNVSFSPPPGAAGAAAAAAPSASASDTNSALPAGWEAHHSEAHGATYDHHAASATTVWEPPTSDAAVGGAPSLPWTAPGFEVSESEETSIY